MAKIQKLNNPHLVAVWPGMGSVAISAGYYLMAKLGMHQFGEFSARGLYDIDQVLIKDGLIQASRWPRSRLFMWQDPDKQRDIIVFIGEAQPPTGKYAFCEGLIELVHKAGVEKVYTFAAMATDMHPDNPSRIFAAATDEVALSELQSPDLTLLKEGRIGGLNGVLLAAAAAKGIRGICLLGEMPHIFAQLPYPKASLAVLTTFSELVGIEVDLTELSQQAEAMDQQLGNILSQVESALERQNRPEETEDETYSSEFFAEPGLPPEEEQLIERLFAEARTDRSKAYELKRELDRLNVFDEYEDRFLDLFKKPD